MKEYKYDKVEVRRTENGAFIVTAHGEDDAFVQRREIATKDAKEASDFVQNLLTEKYPVYLNTMGKDSLAERLKELREKNEYDWPRRRPYDGLPTTGHWPWWMPWRYGSPVVGGSTSTPGVGAMTDAPKAENT